MLRKWTLSLIFIFFNICFTRCTNKRWTLGGFYRKALAKQMRKLWRIGSTDLLNFNAGINIIEFLSHIIFFLQRYLIFLLSFVIAMPKRKATPVARVKKPRSQRTQVPAPAESPVPALGLRDEQLIQFF